MHPSLTSREQDLAAMPAHQALLSNLGILAKSQAHASLLHSTLRTAGNTHAASHAPANPQRVIQRSAVSDIDREAERKYGERMTALKRQRAKRGDSRQEAEQLRRMSEARSNGGIEGDACSLSKSLATGSFNRMRKLFQANPSNLMHKALVSDDQAASATLSALAAMYGQRSAEPAVSDAFDFEEKFGKGFTAHVSEPVRVQRAAVAKPSIAALTKSIEATRQRVEKTLGISPMRHVEKKIATTATLAKSITGGLHSAMPRYTTPQVEAAAGAALAHGAIDAQSAQVIANSLALGGVGAVPSALMAKLRGE